jgi:hypothetical protein
MCFYLAKFVPCGLEAESRTTVNYLITFLTGAVLLINFKISEMMIARLGTLFLVCTGKHKYLLSVFAFPHTNRAI